MPAQSSICGFEVIQSVSAWLVKAERVGAGPSQDGQAKFLQFSDIGGVVYYVRYRVCMGTPDFAVRNFCISIDKLYLF